MGNLPLQQQWIYDWLSSDAHTIILFIPVLGAFVILPILFGLHLYRKVIKPRRAAASVSTAENDSRNNGKLARVPSNAATQVHDPRTLRTLKSVIDITTLLSIVFGWVASIFSAINSFGWVASDETCLPITVAQNVTWIFTKLTIYNVLMIRLQLAFWGSKHEYNPRLMLSAYIVVTVICLVCIVGSFVDVQSIYFVTGWCLYIIPTWLILLPCALDVVCAVFVLCLFLKPLRQLLAKTNLDDDNGGDIKTRRSNKLALSVAQLISKLWLLTTIAVLSNLFGGLFFAVTDIALFTFLDVFINPLCLVLMEIAHLDLYKLLCKCCHVCAHRCIHRNPSIRSRPFGSLSYDDNANERDLQADTVSSAASVNMDCATTATSKDNKLTAKVELEHVNSLSSINTDEN